MLIMDWESKFSSIVRETESNLVKVKHRLGSARTLTNTTLSLNGASPGYEDLQTRFSAHETLGHNFTDRLGNLHISGEPNGFTLEQSPGVMTLLSDKIDAQTRAIETLVRTVSRLEEERDRSHKQVKELKDELSNVQIRMAERGIDLQTEQKIDKWRRDVASEIHHIQNQLKYHRSQGDDGIPVSQVSSFIRDMHDLKRYFQDEMNSLRRDVESFKSRMTRMENDVASLMTDNRDFERRQDRIEQVIRDVNERKRSISPIEMNGRMAEQNFGKFEVAELKSSMKLLENKLANVGSKVQHTKNDKSGYDRSRNKHRLTVTNTTDLLSPLSSDIDLSDFSTDDLADDLKPASKPKIRLSKGESDLNIDDDDDDDDVDFGLTTDDLISTGIDTEDL